MSTAFELHPRLEADTHALGELPSGLVRLHRNGALPWLLLIPRTGIGELWELPPALRARVRDDVDGLCAFVRETFPQVTRLNVASIGNLVPQLHVHVIGRHPGDACWPLPVWGHLRDGPPWSPERVEALRDALASAPAR